MIVVIMENRKLGDKSPAFFLNIPIIWIIGMIPQLLLWREREIATDLVRQ